MGRVYHVSKSGSDRNQGTEEEPFLTIQRAADLAVAGDRVVVHEGVYREWVRPRNGGRNDGCRIIYESARGEHVQIKGSERMTGWSPVKGNVWKICIDNGLFGAFNPYTHLVKGDWIVGPLDCEIHTGEVYLNGMSFYEADSLEAIYEPTKRYASRLVRCWACGR